jgi:putative FmdB family regulatory protein
MPALARRLRIAVYSFPALCSLLPLRNMPTYDYECDACGHSFELFQSIKDPVKKKCPECGKPKLRRLFGTGAAVVFKGSGFYQTDYRSESYKKAAEKDKPVSESKSEGKSDSKLDKKTEAKSTSSEPKTTSGGKKPKKPPKSS